MSKHYELIIPVRVTRNPVTGQFLKGNVPPNKGKKWDDWLSKQGQEKALSKLRRTGNPELPGYVKRSVVAIKDGKLVGVFESASEASRRTGINAGNIRLTCHGKRNHAGGYRWFHEDNNEWIDIITK